MRKIATCLAAALAAAPLLIGAQVSEHDQTAHTHDHEGRMGVLENRPAADPAGYTLTLRDELDLTGRQVAELENIQTHQRALNAPLLRKLRAAMPERPAERPRAERRPGGMRHRSRDRMDQLRPLMQELRANNRKAENEVAAVLTPEQQALLDARREQQRQDVRAEMRDRMRERH